MKRKVIAAALALSLALGACACAQEDTWYEFSADNTVMTVRLPAAEVEGYAWTFTVSDPAALDLITCEDTEDGAYIASFMALGNAQTDAELTLRCASEDGEAAYATRALTLSATAANELSLKASSVFEPCAAWCELSDENRVLTLRAEGTGWSFEIADPTIVELITCDDSDGAYAASFRATGEGQTEILLSDAEGLCSRKAIVSAEGGALLLLQAEEYTAFAE